MKNTIYTLAFAAIIAFPCAAFAQPVTLSAQMANYNGDGAYLALYITDANGAFIDTIHVSGRKSKYYKHLPSWARGNRGRVDGTTGASVRRGRTLTVRANIKDSLIDAGYQIRVDAAVEDRRDSPAEIVVPLTTTGADNTVSGSRYIQSFKYDM